MLPARTFKSVIKVGLVVTAATMGFLAGAAQAATTFTGFSNGCFGLACVPPSTASLQTATLGGLTYTNSTFNVTDAGGFAAIGNVANSPNVDNLGSFTLSGAAFTYTGNAFDLRVTFTAPPGTTPGSGVFTSVLSGMVTAIDNGGVFVDFNNTPQHFTFSGGGSFDLSVNDVSATAGNSVAVTGQITNISAVPEPESYAMMLAGLGLVGFVSNRRKRKA